MSDVRLISEWMGENNETRAYYALDREMLTAHREERDAHAENIARSLLEHANIPLLIRARACMVIGCSNAPDHLDMAKEAVRIAELGRSRCVSPGDFENQLVADCREVCRGAQAFWDANHQGTAG
ncbi:uncharacterized protein RCC_06580 [Ramularia collo-cygni]|uniref:Uncharacterized protein n=1 Tax=Ramularia collo-cygni TaxID=112498 RepID=A0A2D3UTC0_9PEZI|nr:uncharacterized protein RCC_06580 [Ramularia collo-cygni]CZT20722.1 uncharacterized protein RCC_06580 [Ramularia collo-cygni]